MWLWIVRLLYTTEWKMFLHSVFVLEPEVKKKQQPWNECLCIICTFSIKSYTILRWNDSTEKSLVYWYFSFLILSCQFTVHIKAAYFLFAVMKVTARSVIQWRHRHIHNIQRKLKKKEEKKTQEKTEKKPLK